MGYNTIGPLPIASFNTTFTDPLKACECTFQASQASGTPTPSTPIPIVGVSAVQVIDRGVNLLSPSLPANCISGTISATGTAINIATNAKVCAFAVPKNTDLFIQKLSGDTTSGSVALVDTDNIAVGTPYYEYRALTNVTTNTINTGNHGFMIVVSSSQANIEAYWTTRELMIHTGNARVNYVAPTSETTALINLGGTYYGGSVDCVTGKITLTHVYVFSDGTNDTNWSYYSDYGSSYNFRYTYSGLKAGGNIICNLLPKGNVGTDREIVAIAGNGNYINFEISSSRLNGNTVADLMTFFANNNVQIVAELATPLVVYASNTAEIPTINGLNQVFADTGDVTVTYRSTQEFYKIGSIFVTANSNVNVSTESGELASFNTPLALPLVSLKTSIVATESGSGTKSPTNPYTLGGFSNAVISHSGADTSNPDQTTLALGQTVYGGEIVLTKKASGYGVKLRVTHKIYDLADYTFSYYSNGGYFRTAQIDEIKAGVNNVIPSILCTDYPADKPNSLADDTISISTLSRIIIKDESYNGDETAFNTAMANVKLIAKLATPIEIDLTDASDIVALVGTNNVWSDTGDMEVQYKKII